MKANDSLAIVGTWKTVCPEYPLHLGWNLIGYTHWGRPTILPTDDIGDYLGAEQIDYPEGLFYFDPWVNVWKKLYRPDNMVSGKGYWLRAFEPSVIRPCPGPWPWGLICY
jgi:hypothetical protein